MILFSIGTGETFSPPAVTMSSFRRPVTLTKPSASITAWSPECSQPSSSIVALVSFSSFRYLLLTRPLALPHHAVPSAVAELLRRGVRLDLHAAHRATHRAQLPLLIHQRVRADRSRALRLAQQVVQRKIVRGEEVKRLFGDRRRRHDHKSRSTRDSHSPISLVQPQRLLHFIERQGLRQRVEIRRRERLAVLPRQAGGVADRFEPGHQPLLHSLHRNPRFSLPSSARSSLGSPP